MKMNRNQSERNISNQVNSTVELCSDQWFPAANIHTIGEKKTRTDKFDFIRRIEEDSKKMVNYESICKSS